MAVNHKTRAAILATLQAAKDQGLSGLTKTALIKMVYLIDLVSAQDGKAPYTGEEWRFISYGPFSQGIADEIENLSSQGMLQSRVGGGNKEFSFYWLGEYPQGPSLDAMGLSANAASRFNNWIRSFANDLPQLLNFVYFKTAPMSTAKPFDVLSFATSNDFAIANKNPAITNPHDLIELRRLFSKMGKLYVSKSAKAVVHAPIYDDEYNMTLSLLSDEEQVGATEFSAEIQQ